MFCHTALALRRLLHDLGANLVANIQKRAAKAGDPAGHRPCSAQDHHSKDSDYDEQGHHRERGQPQQCVHHQDKARCAERPERPGNWGVHAWHVVHEARQRADQRKARKA